MMKVPPAETRILRSYDIPKNQGVKTYASVNRLQRLCSRCCCHLVMISARMSQEDGDSLCICRLAVPVVCICSSDRSDRLHLQIGRSGRLHLVMIFERRSQEDVGLSIAVLFALHLIMKMAKNEILIYDDFIDLKCNQCSKKCIFELCFELIFVT